MQGILPEILTIVIGAVFTAAIVYFISKQERKQQHREQALQDGDVLVFPPRKQWPGQIWFGILFFAAMLGLSIMLQLVENHEKPVWVTSVFFGLALAYTLYQYRLLRGTHVKVHADRTIEYHTTGRSPLHFRPEEITEIRGRPGMNTLEVKVDGKHPIYIGPHIHALPVLLKLLAASNGPAFTKGAVRLAKRWKNPKFGDNL